MASFHKIIFLVCAVIVLSTNALLARGPFEHGHPHHKREHSHHKHGHTLKKLPGSFPPTRFNEVMGNYRTYQYYRPHNCVGHCNGMKVCGNEGLYTWCVLHCSGKMNTRHICGKERFNAVIDLLNHHRNRLDLAELDLLNNVIGLYGLLR